MSQLAPVWMHAGKIIWSNHVVGLNNIYQKGAASHVSPSSNGRAPEQRRNLVAIWGAGRGKNFWAASATLSLEINIKKDIINIIYSSYLRYAAEHKQKYQTCLDHTEI